MESDVSKMSILVRREIEARVMGPLIEAFETKYGREETREIVKDVIQSLARQSGAELARFLGGNSIKHFVQGLVFWEKNNALKIEVLEQSETVLSFNVLRCGYVEMYKELGYGEFGKLLSCNRDFAFVEGFNPKMKLTRTRTIMDGADYCDFRYRIAEEKKRH